MLEQAPSDRPPSTPVFQLGPLAVRGQTECLSAIRELLKAHHYALDACCDIWDFAVEFALLREYGLTDTDLRWLASKNYVEHQLDATEHEDKGRRFQSSHPLKFQAQSCFVLTDIGVAFASQLLGRKYDVSAILPCGFEQHFGCHSPKPYWDALHRQLRVCDHLVKQFRWPAPNQEKVLATFHDDGWALRIDDPLSPADGQDPKERLHDTIKGLNRRQKFRLVEFHGDGTGEGVVWRFTSDAHDLLGIDLPKPDQESRPILKR